MSDASMTLHRGAREVTRDELAAVPCPTPEPGSIWAPVPHLTVLDHATAALADAGYAVAKITLALSRGDQRFWGTLVLRSFVAEGTSLAVAVASSLDKSIALRFGFGHRVWVCDNGAWVVERTIARKHTVRGVTRYQEAICRAVSELGEYRQAEAARVRLLAERPLTDTEAESLLLRCYEARVLSPRTLPAALGQWREPLYDEFQPRTAWSLFNAVTYALKPRAKASPQAHAAATMRLNGLFTPPGPGGSGAAAALMPGPTPPAPALQLALAA